MSNLYPSWIEQLESDNESLKRRIDSLQYLDLEVVMLRAELKRVRHQRNGLALSISVLLGLMFWFAEAAR